MDFISNQAITPILVGKSVLELVRLFTDLLLVPIVQMVNFRIVTFINVLLTDLHLTS